ncbi:MAG: recombination directionality factor [Methermicoccaceae archaeon]
MIHGLTYRLPQRRQIKIGRKGELKQGKGGRTYKLPQKLDHFEIIKGYDEKGEPIPDTELMAELGDAPTELDIRLPYDDIELVFPTFLAWYSASRCQCRGDGITAKYWDTDANAYVERPCRDAIEGGCPIYNKGDCKPHGILNVMLDNSKSVGGVDVFRTTSWNSIQHIVSCLANIAVHTGGVLHGIPLKLVLKPMEVQPQDVATRQTIYVVHIEARMTPTELIERGARLKSNKLTLLERQMKALPPVEETPEECKAVVEEFPTATVLQGKTSEHPDAQQFEKNPKTQAELKKYRWHIKQVDGTHYVVQREDKDGKTHEAHEVFAELDEGTLMMACSCKDAQYRGRSCIHCHALNAGLEGLIEIEKEG